MRTYPQERGGRAELTTQGIIQTIFQFQRTFSIGRVYGKAQGTLGDRCKRAVLSEAPLPHSRFL